MADYSEFQQIARRAGDYLINREPKSPPEAFLLQLIRDLALACNAPGQSEDWGQSERLSPEERQKLDTLDY